MVTQILEELDLSNNCFSASDILILMRALGNRGARGTIKYLNLRSQKPQLSHEEVLYLQKSVKTISPCIRLHSPFIGLMTTTLETIATVVEDNIYEEAEYKGMESVKGTNAYLESSFIKHVYL